MKKSFIPVLLGGVFSLLVGVSAHADCDESEPLCKGMHELNDALGCIRKMAPAVVACSDDATEADQMTAASQMGRAGLLAKGGLTEDQKAEVNKLFDQLDAAIAQFKANANDAKGRATAIAAILAIRKQGHMEFNP